MAQYLQNWQDRSECQAVPQCPSMSTRDSSVSCVGPIVLDRCIKLDIALDSAHSIVYGLQRNVSGLRA